MAFLDQRLSTCVAYGFAGGPEWQTQLVELENGREQRNADWLYPKHKYAAQYMNFNEQAKNEVLEAFHACRGRLHAFRFKDWNDYRAEDEELLPEIGTDDPLQLVKNYTFGGSNSQRLIQAVVTAQITRNGSPVAGTLDPDTGLFTPDSDWVAGTFAWSGEFDVWVRFASDFNAFAIGSVNAHTSDIELIEVRR